MKKIFILAAMAVGMTASAQSIYELEKLSNPDLNGTSRFVGMGGAMGALGGDMSLMTTNPAGIGLFRKSDVAATLSFASQDDAQSFGDYSKGKVSFDQLGAVFAIPMGGSSTRYMNFGLGYRKNRNFHSMLQSAMSTERMGYLSQSMQFANMCSYILPNEGALRDYGYSYVEDFFDAKVAYPTPLGNAAYKNYLVDACDMFDRNGQPTGEYDWQSYGASANQMRKAMWGSDQEYDLNMAFNISDQYFFGFTLGLHNVRYRSYSLYGENLVGVDDLGVYDAGILGQDQDMTMSGGGVDFKGGLIIRPIQDNPFRFGLAISSPTFYDLRLRARGTQEVVYNDQPNTPYGITNNVDYKFNIHTPWRFNLSLGTTIENCLAIGAEYEYADLSYAKVTYDRGGHYDYWGDWHNEEEDDYALKQEARNYLRGVSTLKLGAEWFVDKDFCVRAGYNYVSSPFKSNAFYNQCINSASLDYATSTDYMNLSDINRLSIGLGLKLDKWYLDAAFMYQAQHGDFYPFTTQMYNGEVNDLPAQRINLNRSKVMLTVGYRF